jgi:uncharacterized protein (TIGR02246 family)
MEENAKERNAIDNLRQAWRAAAAASDLDLYMTFFTSDAVLIPAGQLCLVGHEAIRGFAKGFFDSYRIASEEIITDEVVVAGDWAFERGPYQTLYEPLSGDTQVIDTGQAMYVMKRQPDGSWRYARIISNGISRTAEGGMRESSEK